MKISFSIVFLIFVTLSLVLPHRVFSSGTFYALIEPDGVTWSQVLTFTVNQVVKVSWEYDENSTVPVDDVSSEAVVGEISVESNKKFKVLVNAAILGEVSKESITPILVKIGDNSIPLNQVVEVNTKKIHRTFSIAFAIDWRELETEEFRAEISFTFFPF